MTWKNRRNGKINTGLMNCHPYHYLSRKILNILYIDTFELLCKLLGIEHFKIIY